MEFNNNFNNVSWTNSGAEPSSSLQSTGFKSGYKPSAGVFNWFFNKVINAVNEIQTKLSNFNVVDSLTSTSTTSALSAKQGKVLNDKISPYIGTNNTMSGTNAVAFGKDNTASADCGFASGFQSSATGNHSAVFNESCYANGIGSFAANGETTADGNYSATFGFKTKANATQFVIGRYNDSSYAGTNNLPMSVSQSDNETIFMIGNGCAVAESNALRTTAAGKTRGLQAFGASGADFAEYFEWLDGNPNNEDRRGRLVTLDGEKIRLANSDDEYILGVISASGAFIGNTSSENWQGKYLKDVFGENIYQDVEIPESIDESTGETIPAHTVKRWVINPEYDPEQNYVSREYRKEWGCVGLLGQVVVVDNGTCTAGGYCKPSTNGVATAADSGFKVMKRIDDTHIKVLVK